MNSERFSMKRQNSTMQDEEEQTCCNDAKREALERLILPLLDVTDVACLQRTARHPMQLDNVWHAWYRERHGPPAYAPLTASNRASDWMWADRIHAWIKVLANVAPFIDEDRRLAVDLSISIAGIVNALTLRLAHDEDEDAMMLFVSCRAHSADSDVDVSFSEQVQHSLYCDPVEERLWQPSQAFTEELALDISDAWHLPWTPALVAKPVTTMLTVVPFESAFTIASWNVLDSQSTATLECLRVCHENVLESRSGPPEARTFTEVGAWMLRATEPFDVYLTNKYQAHQFAARGRIAIAPASTSIV